jgi:hypothetical protein
MKEKQLLSEKQYYLIKSVYIIIIILSILSAAGFFLDTLGYIYIAASNGFDYPPLVNFGFMIVLFEKACYVFLMLIFAANKSVYRSKKINIAVIILIISNIPGFFVINTQSYTIDFSWISYIPIAFYIILLIATICVFNRKLSTAKKTANTIFITLLCSSTGLIISFLVIGGWLVGLGHLFLAFILFKAYKDKGFYKYFIETHPKNLIKGRKYFY